MDIPDALHRAIKEEAARKGTTMKQIILRSVERELGSSKRKKGIINLPILESKEPGALNLTNEEIYAAIPFP